MACGASTPPPLSAAAAAAPGNRLAAKKTAPLASSTTGVASAAPRQPSSWNTNLLVSMRPTVAAPVNAATSPMTLANAAVEG
jgi:hypothetical protein